MTPEHTARKSRRSARIQLKVRIEAKGLADPLTCEGETLVVNLHGARISTTVPLRVGIRIEIHVMLTDKRALAQVVWVRPDWPRHCGIGLERPQNSSGSICSACRRAAVTVSRPRPVQLRFPRVPLRAVRRYPCRLIAMSYQRLSLCHGRGREFESRRPRHSF